ncbi:MAG: ribonuclease HI [Sporocytophaga sp.]|uniref:ribonuclease H family protein n=1 Tax=Sporocytophaga sp. TaxID=2231183 RepID=UPI001B1DF1DA|nr:ribonuclease H [Sporocytophaga sp.]MBO9702918.1 ribonuclease HI [Sporocytophaga sp.]
MNIPIIEIFTDGSCHTELKTGGWAALLLINNKEIILKGTVMNTSHNRMELVAVLKAFEYIKNQNVNFDRARVYSDSQYVVNISDRKDKLKKKSYLSNKGIPIQNSDLVKELIHLIENNNIELIKVKAHQKKSDTENYNRKVDKIARNLVREAIA